MSEDVQSLIARLTGSPGTDYWGDSEQDWRNYRPAGGSLPDIPEAYQLAKTGRDAYLPLLKIVSMEGSDSPRFRNALFFLMYFNSLFVYRDLKKMFGQGNSAQEVWIAEAMRKMLIRSTGWSEHPPEPSRRAVSKNTRPGRLSTTAAIVDLARGIHARSGQKVVIRDVAVSDGTSSVELAALAAERGVPVCIVGTDAWLCLCYAIREGDQVVFNSRGKPLQYEIHGKLFRWGDEVPASLAQSKQRLEKAFGTGALERITTIAPDIEASVGAGDYDMVFKEEDLFSPDPDMREADIIRVANLLVEVTDDHRGYFSREEILKALVELGRCVKDGAFLFLDNYRNKIERCGGWQKDSSSARWRRLDLALDTPDVLEGVRDINI